jgi:hypothetical protein
MADDKLATAAAPIVLEAEPASMLDGKVHIGIAVGLKTGDKPSALVVPDVLGVVGGTSPVYLTKPLKLKLEKIQAYLKAKAGEETTTLQQDPKLQRFLTNTEVAINSLYFRKGRKGVPAVAASAGPPPTVAKEGVSEIQQLLLMQFEVDFAAGEAQLTDEEKAPGKGGLIGSLTGDPHLSELFEITSVSLRVLQCDKDNVETLQKYIDAVSED